MHIDVALVPREARTDDGAVLIVVDQIRASTTITTLLDLGCRDLLLAGNVTAARRLARETHSLLAGEWRARKPAGFDFDNSPSELSRADVRGQSVVLSTTNGTAVLHRVRDATHLLIGCLRNARACADAATTLARRDRVGIRIVCAGLNGRFVLEDAIAAGTIATAIVQAVDAGGEAALLTDAATAAVRLREGSPDLFVAMRDSQGGRTLREIGQEEDIAFCAEPDASATVPAVLAGPPMRILRLPG
jgi:2-phosphosulfolactate phosphatase